MAPSVPIVLLSHSHHRARFPGLDKVLQLASHILLGPETQIWGSILCAATLSPVAAFYVPKGLRSEHGGVRPCTLSSEMVTTDRSPATGASARGRRFLMTGRCFRPLVRDGCAFLIEIRLPCLLVLAVLGGRETPFWSVDLDLEAP